GNLETNRRTPVSLRPTGMRQLLQKRRICFNLNGSDSSCCSRSGREFARDDLIPLIGTLGRERVFIKPDIVGGFPARLAVAVRDRLWDARREARVANEHISHGLALRLHRLYPAT